MGRIHVDVHLYTLVVVQWSTQLCTDLTLNIEMTIDNLSMRSLAFVVTAYILSLIRLIDQQNLR